MICQTCKMVVGANEYHPYGACLMMMFCNDGERVRENMKAIVAHGKEIGAKQAGDRIKTFAIAFRRYARRKYSDAHVLQPAVDALTARNPGTAHE